MASHADINCTCPAAEHWKAKYSEVDELLTETRTELDEFQLSSRELEDELERDLERNEKAQRDLKLKLEQAEREKDQWKAKFVTLQTNHNTTTTSLQRDLDRLRQEHQGMVVRLRDLEVGNDEMERNERAISSSLADAEQKYARVLEEKILLEHELLDKANVEEESQRLKDELREANEEVSALKRQLEEIVRRTPSISDHLPSSTASTTSQSPSEEDSLLSTPAPPDLHLSDLMPPPATPAKDFPPISTKTPRNAHPYLASPPFGQARLLHRAGFQPPKSALSTPPSAIPSPMARSNTLPSLSSTPSRIPPRTPGSRPATNRNAPTMSTASTVPGTSTRSRGVQMVSEMRARVRVLEQKITRVPRLRMGSVTNRAAANAMPPPKAGPSNISSPVPSSSSSTLRPHSYDEKSTLKPRRQSIDSDNENRRTPASDTSGWVLIMEDSPSPVKDKEKEKRRTSSPPAPSAFRALASVSSSSPSPPSIGNRAPSVLSQSAMPTRRPQSRLSVSTEGRSSISTNATTSTTSSILTPSSRPSTPTFLPVPTSGMYQSQLGLKRSTGPISGAYSQAKRSSYGLSTTGYPSTGLPSLLHTPHTNVTVRPTSKVSPSASFGQSRIGRPGGGNAGGRKSGGEGESLSDTGGISKIGRGRAGSASALFGRNPL